MDLIFGIEFIFYVIVRDRINLRVIVYLVVWFKWIYVGVVYDDSVEGKYEVEFF